jgi:hypothetical protein
VPAAGTEVKMTNTTRDRPTFIVTLRPEPGVDPIHALRRALKRLLRDHGLRAITVEAQIETEDEV